MLKKIRYRDPVKRNLRRSWNLARGQALHRLQSWDISWEDYYQLWIDSGLVDCRGRGRMDYQLCRRDPYFGWTLDNVEILRRGEFISQSVSARHGR